MIALLLLLPQTDLEKMREFFGPLLEIEIREGQLEFVLEVEPDGVSDYYGSKRELLPSGGGSWGGREFSHRADECQIHLSVERPENRLGFTAQFVTPDESIWISTEVSGLTMIARSAARTVVLLQTPGSHCSLTVDDGTATQVFRAATFDALTLDHPAEVLDGVFAPLEKFIDRAPLTRMSPEVVELALAIRPPTADEATRVGRWLARLDDESADERDAATRELGEFLAANPALMQHFHAQGEAGRSPEVQTRVQGLLRADERRWEAYKAVADGALYRDLSYLAFLLSAGKDAGGRLEALTGKSFESADAWRAWIGESGGKLKWDSERWGYVEP